MPDDAGLVAPVTEAEKAATRSMLTWVAEVLDWGRENQSRATTARSACK